MTPALPLMHDEVFLEEHRRIRLRLLRLRKFASPESGFPTVLSSLIACVDEIEMLVPDLMEHFAHEERVFFMDYDAETATEGQQKAEQVLAEHLPLLRELRALLESGRTVIEELRASGSAGSMAEALKVYLAATVEDLLEHEEREGQFYASH